MKMPRDLYSAFGSIPVVMVDNIPASGPEMMCLGRYQVHKRSVEISREVTSEEAQVEVLFHEWVHVALLDSGLAHLLDDNVQEAVCDAVGGLLAGAMLNGNLVLRNSRK